MSVNPADAVLAGIILADFGGMLIVIGASLYLAYTRMDELLNGLKNCSAVMNWAPLRYGGPWGKLCLIGAISGVVTFSGFHLRHGSAGASDLANLPAYLKRRLALLQGAAIVLMAVMILLFIYLKLIR